MEFDYLDKNAVLQCKELTKTYFQGDLHIHAVKDVFLRVQPGSEVMVIGAAVSIEIWHPEKWIRYIERRMPKFRKILTSLSKAG